MKCLPATHHQAGLKSAPGSLRHDTKYSKEYIKVFQECFVEARELYGVLSSLALFRDAIQEFLGTLFHRYRRVQLKCNL